MDKTDLVSFLAIVVIVISVVILGFSLTGKVTDTGVVNVTVESVVSINFTTDFLDFQAGSVSTGQASATLYTNGTVVNGNWTSPGSNFVIENIGNNNVTLDIASGKTAADFIGGTSPDYEYNVSNVEASSCTNATGFSLGVFYDVNATSPGTRVCSVFEYIDSRDTISIDLKLVIPSDAAGGEQTDTFTATATAV